MMAKPKGTRDSRSSDLTCSWLTRTYGEQWEAWRNLAEKWLRTRDRGLQARIHAVKWFLETYLVAGGLPSEPAALFAPNLARPDLMAAVGESLKSSIAASTRNNCVVEFLDWVIEGDFCEIDDNGHALPLVANPFRRQRHVYGSAESVWNPLPYAYIQELRSLICPNPRGRFGEWTRAQRITGNASHGPQGDWFEVVPDRIDPNDPDCVWRQREVMRNAKKVAITELWSPVCAVALLIKLHLPLRTYQVRMLDSGEADTWRYEHGCWVPNRKHPFALGREKAPWERGVFRRILAPEIGEVMTGLYVNTNKSADQNTDGRERGYTIPWQHEDVLYWLARLRDWQEKYNPIDAPTVWRELERKHLGENKSRPALERMGESCFLFRDASAKRVWDRAKPMPPQSLLRHWYRVLLQLETGLVERGQTLANGARLRLVKDYEDTIPKALRTATEFPLHSLRVSLITCYAMDGQVPLPVLSKLLAGHSRILMTIYYNKITPAVMRRKMGEAAGRIDAGAQQSLRAFLEDAQMHQIKAKTVAVDAASAEAALANRNPIGWAHRHIGLCLVGGNTAKSDEVASVAGCWNGGEPIKTAANPDKCLYAAVPHGPENCVRCRWFLTDARYLDALRAHFNNLSYHASLAATLAVALERKKEALEDARFEADQAGRPFTAQAQLQAAERRFETQMVDADAYAKDLRACFTLIHRIVEIESARDNEDDRQKLFAVGGLHDIHHPIGLIETDSTLWQLAEICEDAEVFADLADDVRKTPAVVTRSQILSTMLMREGYAPVFMQMDEEMQLIMGNALMRAMAQKASADDWRIGGFRRVCGIIEAGHSLGATGLLDHGIEALQQQWPGPVVRLNELTRPVDNNQLEADDGAH